MKHTHHIIPRHMGGSDDPSNLIEITREEHAQAHLKLYEHHGKKEDMGAYYLLSGQSDEAAQICSSLGGTVQGKINAENGHMARIQKLGDVVAAGKKGGATTISRGKGAFGDPNERLKSAKKGGLTQGKRNAESGHLKRISQLVNPRNLGKYWITNGKNNKMIDCSEIVPEGYVSGKIQKKNLKDNTSTSMPLALHA
jgi:hypothetical protein